MILPLWSPSPVALGAVGYLSKPSGAFVTLFNAFEPMSGLATIIPSIDVYGRVKQRTLRQDKRSIVQKGMDALSGLMSYKSGGDSSVSCVD